MAMLYVHFFNTTLAFIFLQIFYHLTKNFLKSETFQRLQLSTNFFNRKITKTLKYCFFLPQRSSVQTIKMCKSKKRSKDEVKTKLKNI